MKIKENFLDIIKKNIIKKIFFLILVLILIIFNPFILEYFSPDRNLGKNSVIYILLCDSFLLLTIFTSYLFFYKKKNLKRTTNFFLIANITLLPIFLIGVIEGFFQFYRININFIDKSDAIAAHVQTFSKEYKPIKLYENFKYVYAPLKSEHININNQGFRTYDFNIKKKEKEKRIIILGGSTTFGYNLADKNTISKQLEKMYKNQNTKVFNLGMNHFNFNDEVITIKMFIETIKPNKIIFYHGLNDVIGKVYKKVTGNNVYYDQKKIDELNYFEKKTLLIKTYLINKSFYMIFSTYYKKIFPYKVNIDITNYQNLINNQVNQNYMKLYKDLNKDICNKKECFFFLQPNILHKRNKTVFEQIIANHFISNKPLMDKIYNDYFDIIISQNKNNICDLRRIFNNTNDNIFLEEVHVNSIGNLIIAKEIYNIINKENNLC